MANRSSTKAAKSTAADLSADARIVVLHGPEAFLRASYLDRLQELNEVVHGTVDRITFDGNSAAIADILDECRSPGLLAQHKLVVVDAADQLLKKSEDASADSRKLMESYAEHPDDSATLVLRADRKLTGNLITKLIPHIGVVLECAEVTEAQAMTLLIKAAKEQGMTLDRPAAGLMVERLGASLGRLRSELDKLIAAAAGQHSTDITPELVGELIAPARESDPWLIQGPLLTGSAEASLVALFEQLDVSRQPTPLVRHFVYDLARKLHRLASGLEDGEAEGQLVRELKMFGPAARTAPKVARKAGSKRLAQLVRECAASDQALKTGRADDRRSLESLVVRFASVTG